MSKNTSLSSLPLTDPVKWRPVLARLLLALLALPGLDSVRPALAQPPALPPQWFDERAPSVEGQAVSFCVDARQPGFEFHRALAEAIGDALLLETRIVEVEREVVVEAEYDHLYVDLVDHCTSYLGFKLYSNAYPEWLAFTRPIYEGRFVVLSSENGPVSLTDVPPGSAVGVVQGSMGDIRFLTFNNTLPPGERWQRLPLGSPNLALEALADGRVEALVIWEAWWQHLLEGDPRYAEFRPMNAELVSEPWIPVGAALPVDRTAPQFLLDQAIAELQASGVIQELIEEFGFPARVPR